jgi:hypothetical protein
MVKLNRTILGLLWLFHLSIRLGSLAAHPAPKTTPGFLIALVSFIFLALCIYSGIIAKSLGRSTVGWVVASFCSVGIAPVILLFLRPTVAPSSRMQPPACPTTSSRARPAIQVTQSPRSPASADRIPNLVRTLMTPCAKRVAGSPAYGPHGLIEDAISQATEALVKVGGPAVAPLLAALNERLDEYCLGYVIDALGNIGDRRATDALLKLTSHTSKYVRNHVLSALCEIGDPRAIDLLLQTLREGHWLDKVRAAEGLGKIGDPRATDSLIAALKDEEKLVRKSASEALGSLKDKNAIEALIKVSTNDNIEQVRKTALKALEQIDPGSLQRAQKEVAEQAVPVSPDGKALFEKLHSGKAYTDDNPVALVGTEARVYCIPRHHSTFAGRWVLCIPTGGRRGKKRLIPIDIDNSPDRAVCAWLEKCQRMQVELQVEGKIYHLLRDRSSDDEISIENPILISNLAYIYMDSVDHTCNLRVPVGAGDKVVVVPATLVPTAACESKGWEAAAALDRWVLDTISALGLSLVKERVARGS